MSTIPFLKTAKQKIMEGDTDLAYSFYGRALAENIPQAIVKLHQITKGYTLLSMCDSSPIAYFEYLKQFKKIVDNNETYKQEYLLALRSLLNLRELFLRDISINYFSEISTCSWSSSYAYSLNDVATYLESHLEEIVDLDCYGLSTYIPESDLNQFRTDLEKIIAYSLNMLLMYVGVKNTTKTGKSYYSVGMDFGSYYVSEIKSRDTYSSNAVVMPRLHFINLDAYYDDYLARFNALCEKLNFSSQAELKKEVSRLVDRRNPKDEEEKEFFNYAKLMAKEDLERLSYFTLFGSLNPFYGMIKPILKFCLGSQEVGSFELDNPFNRKRWLGVCNMIAWANNWSIETVRAIMLIASCFGIGVIVYLGLALAIKTGYCLPNLILKKH